MSNEEKKLLLKDLCGRIPYGVMVHVHIDKNCIDAHNHIHSDYDRPLDTECFNWYVGLDGVTLKPYLRPMSSMTEEEKKKVHYFVESHKLGNCSRSGAISDYLNSIHIDYRDLIPMGLALPATDGMYDTKTE